MRAEVVQVKDLVLVGRSGSNHWVTLDTRKEVKGHEGANAPMELVLISLAGCTAMDVISILNKMRVPYARLEVSVDSERAEEHPKVFTKIRLHYKIFALPEREVPTEKVERAIHLSQERYCSVTAMLRKTAEITYDYEIVSVESENGG